MLYYGLRSVNFDISVEKFYQKYMRIILFCHLDVTGFDYMTKPSSYFIECLNTVVYSLSLIIEWHQLTSKNAKERFCKLLIASRRSASVIYHAKDKRASSNNRNKELKVFNMACSHTLPRQHQIIKAGL